MADVALTPASADEAPVLENLMQLYVHDMSATFPIEIDESGRFRYDALPAYWREPDRRFPFLIRRDGCVAGFVLVTRGTPVTDDPDDLDLAEFFVLRRWRRGGTGRAAAIQLWDRMPGRWVVRVSSGNATGLAFWRSVVREYAGESAEERTRPGPPHGWSDFVFRSRTS
jgi:predicted acetyltransferase